MNQITKEFQTHKVRIIEENGEPLFVAADVGKVFELTNIAQTIKDYTSKERGIKKVYTPSGDQDMIVLTEKGLYKFMSRSNSLKAEDFQDWLFGEVLPTIRKTGQYKIEPTVYGLITQAEALITALKKAQPKADVYDKIVETEGLHSVNEAAKILGTGQKRLYAELREKNILTKDNVPYQRFIEQGYFQVKETLINIGMGKTKPHAQTFVTGKGLVWLGGTR